MDSKDKILLKLIDEIHGFCKKFNIVYYLDETEKRPFSVSIMMDASSIKRFLKEFTFDTDCRALEWAGNNHAIVGDDIKYINTETFYYTQDRLVRDIHLGMFITIKPISKSSSRLTNIDRIHRHMDFMGTENRSRVLNYATKKIHSSRLTKVKGRLKESEICEVKVDGVYIYVKRKSGFETDPEDAWDKLIPRKADSDTFICDETISYKDIGLGDDRRRLAAYERHIDSARRSLRKGEALQNKCIQLSNASYCRYLIATDLLMKYTYDEIADGGKENGEIRMILDDYIKRATTLKKKGCSGYIGDEFTKIINNLYPEINTDDLYAHTPDLYKEGIKVYDYKGKLLGIYGGSDGN